MVYLLYEIVCPTGRGAVENYASPTHPPLHRRTTNQTNPSLSTEGTASRMIEVGGNMLEGGGQIVRTTIALSALTGKSVTISKIRDKRPNPGLQPQHVVAVKTVAAICNAATTGLTVGSRELTFTPHGHAAGQLSFDVGTAGSIALILQALMPSAAYASGTVELDLTGGTDVPWSPSIDYVRLIELPVLYLMGYRATVQVQRRGHYPKGGGRVFLSIDPPRALTAIKLLQRGELLGIEGISHCVRLPSHVAQRQANAAKEKLNAVGFTTVNIATETYPPDQDTHLAPGSGITLLARFANGAILGSDSIGERGKPAEKVGADAADKLVAELTSQAPVDRHMGDILIPYMAVAEGTSEIQVSEITMHTITNIKVVEMVAGVKFEVEGELHKPGKITIDSMALKA